MKKMLLTFAAVAAVAVGLNLAGFLPPNEAKAAVPTSAISKSVADETLAAAKYQANLRWDGGATGTSQVVCFGSVNATVVLQPVFSTANPNGNKFCYKTCTTSTCVPDCSKDLVLNQTSFEQWTPDSGVSQSGFQVEKVPVALAPIEMSNDKCIVISNPDAGNPNVNLYQLTKAF